MKVGTDGTLLGAWAEISHRGADPVVRILDLGTGTGLVALMMAQRFPEAQLTGIDIDGQATCQARENVAASPFGERISILQADVNTFAPGVLYDAVVCNPPYFVNSLTCPDSQRTTARHALSLTYEQLMAAAWRLLGEEGRLSVVMPMESLSAMEAEARLRGFFPSRFCTVRTTPRKAPKRCLMEFRKHPVDEVVKQSGFIEESPGRRSQWYHELTKDFYIR